MVNIQIDKKQTFASLYSTWKEYDFVPLSIQLEFNLKKTTIYITNPNGQAPNEKTRKYFKLLENLFTQWDEIVECNMNLCMRTFPFRHIGQLAFLKGRICDIVSCLGWSIRSPIINDNASINEQLSRTSNDYWAVEMVANSLGLDDIVNGTTPHLKTYPNFSFIIPGRGIHNTINDVIESIKESINDLCNEKVRWECIIVDDANEIPLDTVIKCNEHVRIIRTETQVYCGGARNIGIKNAKYDTIFFLDGDTLLSSNYIKEHLFRHLLSDNLITVSLREYLKDENKVIKNRIPDISKDTRVFAHYSVGRLGLIPVDEPIDVEALKETNEFRKFGLGRRLGPADLPFMVKGNNISVNNSVAKIFFPPDFVGYGPEDGMFAAKAISRGCFVIPVLSTGVFHINHPPRSGDIKTRDNELVCNLNKMQRHLHENAWTEWTY